ncbi:MAG: SxtJ family membrane protein, partial [Deltaproteobacteria bacterium]|nr:SxtJ family membrane protein [Deltaproteobacteria bacterium]
TKQMDFFSSLIGDGLILDEIKNIQSSKKELRMFGLSVGGVFFALGLILLFFGRHNSYYLLAGGGALIIAGAAFPRLLLPLQKVWMSFAVVMGWFMTRVIVTLMYWLVLTPIGLAGRAAGKDFLDLKVDARRDSYWRRREAGPCKKSDYERQF